jgi:hypothetical protein
MIKPIGGYFEWEFPTNNGSFPHSDGILLNSGRHSLEYILKSLGTIKRLWIPYYTCDVVLQPIERLGTPYSFYRINKDFTLAEEVVLSEDEYLIYTNYFGLMDAYCQEMANRYGNQLILDCAQAFFAPRVEGINTFYSPRKFVGVPDGGITYADNPIPVELPADHSYDKCAHLLKRHDLTPMDGYNDFKESSHKIASSPLSLISTLTQKMLSSLDYEAIKGRRLSNFTLLHTHLAASNELQMPSLDSISCPMVYPYYTKDLVLRKCLITNQVFVATYWPNVFEWTKEGEIEYELSKNIIPIPIDQRYDDRDMMRIVEIINQK